MCSEWDRKAHTRVNRNDLLAVALFALHLAPSGQDKPDFFDGAMRDGTRGFTRSEFKMSETTTF